MHAQSKNAKVNAKELRRHLTDPERILWKQLCSRQLHCKFRRQHPYLNFILDFVCLDRKIVIEVDGSQHADQASYDQQRSQTLEQAGFAVLRFWNNEIIENLDGVMAVVLDHLAVTHPHPNPPLEGEGVANHDQPARR
ncbi:MAG: endonuclease domain-containing protein [Burkholderiaceae bacterium]|nr:MAG: endonuclease domain-containing protein [Burkholderiaceae bacterium]